MTEPVITITDIIKAGHCVAGAKTWFRAHSLDFKAFLNDGLPESVLLNTNDALAIQVVERTRNRRNG